MKPLLILCLLILPVQAQKKQSPTQPAVAQPPGQIQPLPRSIEGQPQLKGTAKEPLDSASKIQESLKKRRAQITEAREKARAKARAKRKDEQPKRPEIVLPASSSSRKELSGSWLLQDESMRETLEGHFQEAAGKGATFKLGEIKGNYVASVNSDLSRITVMWEDWKMHSTTTRGENAVTLSVSVKGTQDYEIRQITDGKRPENRTIRMKLIEDKTSSESFFEGAKIRSKVKLPLLPSGYWSLHDGILYLQGSDQKTAWQFTPRAAE